MVIRLLIGRGILTIDAPKQEFSETIGAAFGNVSRALKGDKQYLTSNFLKRVGEAYKDIINPEWLLTGEGEMTVSDNVTAGGSVIRGTVSGSNVSTHTVGDNSILTVSDGNGSRVDEARLKHLGDVKDTSGERIAYLKGIIIDQKKIISEKDDEITRTKRAYADEIRELNERHNQQLIENMRQDKAQREAMIAGNRSCEAGRNDMADGLKSLIAEISAANSRYADMVEAKDRQISELTSKVYALNEKIINLLDKK